MTVLPAPPSSRAGARPPPSVPAAVADSASAPREHRTVRVLDDPEDAPPCIGTLTARHDPERGVVVCLPQPTGGSRARLAEDLLVAVGKRPGGLAAEGVSRQAWELAERWLRAERVRELIVLRADRLPAARWPELAGLAAAAGARLWLVTHGAVDTSEHHASLATVTGGHPPEAEPWRVSLAALGGPTDTLAGDAADEAPFPAVPDVEFPRFRATARRLLEPTAFARVDAVYRDTYVRARGLALDLRLSLLGRDDAAEPGRARSPALDPLSRWDRDDLAALVDAVLQCLTIDATSAAAVLTRVRAAQAGLFVEGLFVDLRPRRMLIAGPTTTRLEPRLDHATVARLRGLATPTVAAAVTLARATGLPADRLRRLSHTTAPDADGALHVRLGPCHYRVPARAAAAVRAVRPHPATAGSTTTAEAASGRVLVDADGLPLAERDLERLCARGAALAGVALPRCSFGNAAITDLHGLGLPRIGP